MGTPAEWEGDQETCKGAGERGRMDGEEGREVVV